MGKYWNQSDEAKQKISAAAKKRYKNNSKIMQCLNCGTEYKIPLSRYESGRGKYCSKKCMTKDFKGKHLSPETEFVKGQEAWNKGVKSGAMIACEACGKTTYEYNSKKRKYCSPECASRANSGENHHKWAGDDVGYSGVHTWVYKVLGAPMICKICNTKSAPRYHWHNTTETYERNIEDWQRLCAKCHKNLHMGNK